MGLFSSPFTTCRSSRSNIALGDLDQDIGEKTNLANS
jgi:hypothetical protein